MEELIIEGFTLELHQSIVHVTWTGEATETEIRALRNYAAACQEELGKDVVMNALVDASAATGVGRDARKELNELGRDKPWERVAFVGVRFEIKVLLELIMKALQLLRIETAEVVFLDTRAEGLAWLEGESARSPALQS